ncbi:MAG: purine-nucleoside phosphorylase [Candidatus Eisenbacteria bacterium]
MNDAGESDLVRSAVAHLRARFPGEPAPRLAVVLGSGLGGIAASLERRASIDATEVPGLPSPSVAGHGGRIHRGWWGAVPVLLFEGRGHLYEGHDAAAVTRNVRVAAALGARDLVLTNAAGSCDPDLPAGSLMRASDLLDLFFRRLRGTRDPGFVGRGGGGVLDPALGRILDRAAREARIVLHRGTLCGAMGPSYETASEIRLARRLGASAVTMSTIPEAFAGRAAGMRVAVVSLLSNFATGVSFTAPLRHEDVLASASDADERLARLLGRAASILGGGERGDGAARASGATERRG